MAGTLLSGFRIRLFNQSGQPLYPGRVSFFDSSTSSSKTVYADYELTTALGTTVTTDLEGYLPPIWLASGLYDATVEQQISIDPEDWDVLWTIDNLGSAISGGVGIAGSVAYVENVNSMKSLPSGIASMVICAGYYNANDCGEPLYFTWQSGSNKADDGGAYIRDLFTAPGSTGRYHQVLGTVLDVRKWGAIPNNDSIDCIGAITACENYAGDSTVYLETPPTVAFIGSGSYKVSGSISFSATWYKPSTLTYKNIPYLIEKGAWIKGSSGTFTISNPTTINSDEKITEYPMALDILPLSVNYLRPQWYPNYYGTIANKLEFATMKGLPVRLYGDYDFPVIDGEIIWSECELYIDTPTLMTVDNGGTLTINSQLTVANDAYVFNPIGTGVIDITKSKVNAAWFGYGTASGTAHGTYLQKAITACNSGVVIVPSVPTGISIRSNVSGGKALGTYITYLEVNGVIPISGAGLLEEVGIRTSLHKIFDITENGRVGKIHGTHIDPFWFGVASGFYPASIASNHTKLTQAMNTAMESGIPLDGYGRTVAVSDKIILTPSSTSKLHLKDISIPATSWVGSNGYLLAYNNGSTDPYGDVILENVDIDTLSQAGVHSVYIYSNYLSLTNCNLVGDSLLAGEVLNMVGCTSTRSTTSTGLRIFSSTYGGSITGCKFSDNLVSLCGNSVARPGRTYPMLENLTLTGNTFINTDGLKNKGCVRLTARATNTLVNGIVIVGNTFAGNIGANDTYVDADRTRIYDGFDGGNWYNGTDAVRHLLTIKNNTYNWSDPYRLNPGTPPPTFLGHFSNYLPQTSGAFDWQFPITALSATATHNYCTFSLNPEPIKVFLLTGTGNSKATSVSLVVDYAYINSAPVGRKAITGGATLSGNLNATTSNSGNASFAAPISQIFTWVGTGSYVKGTCNFRIYEES